MCFWKKNTITFSSILITEIKAPESASAQSVAGRRYYFGPYTSCQYHKQLRHIENSIVLYKKEGNNGLNIVHRRTASLLVGRHAPPYADAQYWGRYGRCIVKGYRLKLTLTSTLESNVSNVHLQTLHLCLQQWSIVSVGLNSVSD